MHEVEPWQVNVCHECENSRHTLCDGKARCWGVVRRCDCDCGKVNTIMSNKFLLLAATTAGCISASSISSRLSYLDKYTNMAVLIRDSNSCKNTAKSPMCILAETCLIRSAVAAVSCKVANDSAASKHSADIQYVNDKACRLDLEVAESSCKSMRESNGIHEDSKDAGNNGIPDSARGTSDAGTGGEGNNRLPG